MDEEMLKAWATRTRAGDETSFRRLVETLTRTLIAMAYRYTGDWEWARDLTQETWVRVHQRIDGYDPGRSFVTWLYAIHRNGCVDHVRRPWVGREVLPGAERLATAAGPAADDPSLRVEEEEFRARVLSAMERLSPRQREVFRGVDLDGGHHDEVARELGMSPGNLRTTLHFARRRLAALLGGGDET